MFLISYIINVTACLILGKLPKKIRFFLGYLYQICLPNHPRVFVRFGKTKGEIWVEKGDFRGNLGVGGLRGLDLVWESATPPTHIWERSPKKRFFWTPSLIIRLFSTCIISNYKESIGNILPTAEVWKNKRYCKIRESFSFASAQFSSVSSFPSVFPSSFPETNNDVGNKDIKCSFTPHISKKIFYGTYAKKLKKKTVEGRTNYNVE